MGSTIGDAGVGLRVGLLDVAEGLPGEDHAPTEGVVGTVALHDADVRVRERLPRQDGEVEPARPAADPSQLAEHEEPQQQQDQN